jgi:hypothetical protein
MRTGYRYHNKAVMDYLLEIGAEIVVSLMLLVDMPIFRYSYFDGVDLLALVVVLSYLPWSH